MQYLNYETEKLLIQNPTISNALIFLALLCLAGLTWQRKKNTFLDRTQTDQLKGVAILFVVTGHLWTHVSLHGAVPNFAGYAVALFLFLSGYGLARSWEKKPLTAIEFATRRITRVMLPYWIATAGILFLDYWLLGRQYSVLEIVSTLAGMNFSPSLRFLDYARWYITLILIFYCVFFLVNKFLSSLQAIAGLFVFSLFLFVLRRLEIFPFGALFHFVAFPLGCLVACFHGRIKSFVMGGKLTLPILLFVTLAGALLCAKIPLWIGNEGMTDKIILLGADTCRPLFLCAFLIAVFALLGTFNLCSRFFMFCGIISYEIYLLHGPLLIKYNPIFPYFSSRLVVVAFLVFVGCILVLSYGFKRFHKYAFAMSRRLLPDRNG